MRAYSDSHYVDYSAVCTRDRVAGTWTHRAAMRGGIRTRFVLIYLDVGTCSAPTQTKANAHISTGKKDHRIGWI